MKATLRQFNSQQAAHILDVNVSTIKRWTAEGKLECLQTPGGHRKFTLAHLAGFLRKYKGASVNVSALDDSLDTHINYQLLTGNFEYLVTSLLNEALNGNRRHVHQILNGLYIMQYPLYQIYDELITPVLHEIGHRWVNNKISVTEEHIASQVIRDCLVRLQGLMELPARTQETALCLTLSNELHDIALKMIDHLLEERGFRVLYTGQITPVIDIEALIKSLAPNRMYISITTVVFPQDVQKELDFLMNLGHENQIQIFVGGQGLNRLHFTETDIVTRLYSFKDIYKM